jgi:Virulence-associated protein E/Bifunctional DNA primase/polymerase, N-terminal/Primase C terminal 2 (PriCT-2)
MLDAALAYSRMRWRVFPLHTSINGACSCGKQDCSSPAKHPRTKDGFRSATDDPDTIRSWWRKFPDSNIGIATGGGLAVLDIDGAQGALEFKALVEAHGPLPDTLVARTGNGYHAFYAIQAGKGEIRSTAVGKVHTRGEGGYVVGVPSRHASGRTYEWVRKNPLAMLPDWVRQWTQGYKISASTPKENILAPVPAYLQQNQYDPGASLQETLKTVYSPAEEARITSALSSIPVKTCSYEDFFRIGMALKELDWERSDGTDIGFSIWDAWCAQSEHYNPAGLEFKWKSFGRRTGVTLGTVYHMAREAGWNGGAPDPAAKPVNGVNGVHALPAAFLNAPQAIHFPDVNEDGFPKVTCTNAGVAVTGLQIKCCKDLFHEKFLVDGQLINQWSGEMSDEVIQMIRKVIRARYGFDPGEKNVRDACTQLCLENQFDPVLDYLDGLRWDGAPRLETWMTRYMGAADSPLTRAVGRLSLIAAVRRARLPGTKFDQIIVLEGLEGRGKSTALEILAGSDNFSDQKILGLGDREQQEATSGIWLFEIGELTGMRKAEVEHIKAFASRTVDRARPAYGHYRIDRPRRTVFFATTNREDYLQSDTGNRRFWPVTTGHIDLDGLRRDRDQLWSEAAACEARGDSIVLPEALWSAAAEQQEARMAGDDWLELIARWLSEKNHANVSATQVLCDNQYILRRADAVTSSDCRRVARIMKQLNWEHRRMRVAGSNCPASRYLRREA